MTICGLVVRALGWQLRGIGLIPTRGSSFFIHLEWYHSKEQFALFSKYNTSQFSLYCSLNSVSCLIGGPEGQTTNTTSLVQHATSLGYVSRANIELHDTGYCVLWLFQPPCNCRLHSCICCKPTQKNKKDQQYLFLSNNFNAILKHLTYIWYYTMGLCN